MSFGPIARLLRPGIACAASLLTAFSLLAGPMHAADNGPQALTVTTPDGPIPITLFPGGQDGKRPAVIILHGRQGIDTFAGAYTRYARALSSRGIDAVALSYYDASDTEAMASSDATSRRAYFAGRLPTWSMRIRDVVTFMARRGEFSGKIGLLGFSNGGFLAVATAASDPRIDALVVFYGGLAGVPKTGTIHLPPLLTLHGDADRVVPLASGKALVEKAQALGGAAELIVYPGAGHGFDFNFDRADAKDAFERSVSFLTQQLR
jgi:carboxymethylenebutenolidase